MSFDYTEIIDFLPDATFVIDNRGVVVAWNRAIEKMTGVTATEIVGKGDFVYAVPFYRKQRPILIDLMENRKTNLSEIASSFSKKLYLQYHSLTPREIQIADFIRQGKSNKEMAYLLKISVSAVDFHRRNLREKLDIKEEKINLRSFLLSHVG